MCFFSQVAELAKLAVKSAEDASIVEAEREALEAESEFIAAHQYEDLLTPEDYALLQKARAQDVEDYNAEMKSGAGPDPSPFRVAFEQALQMPLKKKTVVEKSALRAKRKTAGKRAGAGRGVLETGVYNVEMVGSRVLKTKASQGGSSTVVVAPPRKRTVEVPIRKQTVTIPVEKAKPVEVDSFGKEFAVPSSRRGTRLARRERAKRWAQQQQTGRRWREEKGVGGAQPNLLTMITRDAVLLTPEEEIECTQQIRVSAWCQWPVEAVGILPADLICKSWYFTGEMRYDFWSMEYGFWRVSIPLTKHLITFKLFGCQVDLAREEGFA